MVITKQVVIFSS